VLQLTLELDLGSGLYVEPYVYAGFIKPLRDESSEVGMEVGWEGDIAEEIALNLAVGRWANYGGLGLGVGDWFGRVGVSHRDSEVSLSWLTGENDTALINASYRIAIAQKATLSPSLAFVTATGAFNLAAEGSYDLTPGLAFRLRAASPLIEGRRHFFASGGLAWSF
jgi:hypothetical protein